jgi:murein DD-endopeptidase MepM/ murein hydrolase activator NlpD
VCAHERGAAAEASVLPEAVRIVMAPELVRGSGLFNGVFFFPLIPALLEWQPVHGSAQLTTAGTIKQPPYIIRDFTTVPMGKQQPLQETWFKFDVGKYDERRVGMYTTDLFGTQGNQRDIHIGLDVGGPVGTAVHAIHSGKIHSVGYNPADGDYGHVIVTEHTLANRKVWALHGHLSASSSSKWRAGDDVQRGDVIGWLGAPEENGGWPPHVHFQLSLREPPTHDMPGVVNIAQRAESIELYPDPRMVLGRLYDGEGLWEATPTMADGDTAHEEL